MKTLCLATIFFAAAIGASAQCVSTPTDACVGVHQSILDRSAKAIDELQAAQTYIATLLKQTAATDAERAAYQNLSTIAQSTITILQTGITDRDKVIELQQKALQTMADLNDKILAKLNAPKSGWAKFKETLKEIALIAAGIAIGRGGL